MNIIEFPPKEEWGAITKRPAMELGRLRDSVAAILAEVRHNGDEALCRYSQEFDRVELHDLEALTEEFENAESMLSPEVKAAIAAAMGNIEKFHSSQFHSADLPEKIETTPGVECWRRDIPIEKVGLYVPAGSAPLFSTVLMLAIPARLAGCREVILCTPPDREGLADAATLFAARACGVTRVFKVGGAQAIAAMTFGTGTIPRVYKIFGPGNQYVTEAKLQAMRFGVAIDMPAGPSEVAILADETAVPEFVAADLLAQAEHGTDSQVMLVSTSRRIIDESLAEVELQLKGLPRREIASAALMNSKAILVENLETGISLINEYAPEHLIIATAEAENAAGKIINAGSVFIGNFSCESAGDYASGTNHTLPTGAAARAFSGVSVASFMKSITFQRLSETGIRGLGPIIETLASAEGLEAHKRAVTVRRKWLGDRDEI